MARHLFGGGVADWTFTAGDAATVGALTGQDAVVVGGVVVTMWSAESGGTQYTDLSNDADGLEPISSVTSSTGTDGRAVGQIPPFYGPDGIASLWAQAGSGPRSRMIADGTTGIEGSLTGTLNFDGTLNVDGPITATGSVTVGGDLAVTGGLTLGNSQLTAFTKGIVMAAPAVGAYPAWRSPKPAIITAVRGYRVGGSGASINAHIGGVQVLSVDLSLSTTDTWLSDSSPAAATVNTGDTLQFDVTAVSGPPTLVVIQVDMRVS